MDYLIPCLLLFGFIIVILFIIINHLKIKYKLITQELKFQEKNLTEKIRKNIYDTELSLIKSKAEEKIQKDKIVLMQNAQLEYENYRFQLEKQLKDFDDVVNKKRLELENYIGQIDQEKEKISAELNDYKSKYAALIKTQKEKEQNEQYENFHSILLKPEEKEDIKYLEGLVGHIRRPQLLYKLIWSEYIQKPTKEMIDRVVGKNKICGIYKITNKNSGRAYIGQSTDIGNRWINHIKTICKTDGGAARTKFHDMVYKDGLENFLFEILEECEKEKLNEREKYYINFFQTTDFGYNSTKGGS